MSSIERDILKRSRPRGFTGRGDKYLAEIAGGLRRHLVRVQNGFESSDGVIEQDSFPALAVILVEFAEDIHCDLGIWAALETLQGEMFGTPLPFYVSAADADAAPLEGFDPRRLAFLLWTLLPKALDVQVLDPHHENLIALAAAASEFLTERFAKIPQDSGLKKFLATANTHAYDIKGKLVWLGTRSYLFAALFAEYCEVQGEQPESSEIGLMDDFCCQSTTDWSGLGVADILAEVLGLEGEDRANLCSWYDRHLAMYRVLEVEHDVEKERIKKLTALNLVNREEYEIAMNFPAPYVPKLVISGSLTPWRGVWYWSGEQRTYGKLSEQKDAELRRAMLEKSATIAYRYCPDEAEKAREILAKRHADFLERYGDELVAFPDGKALEEAENARVQAEWDASDAPRPAGKTPPLMSLPPAFHSEETGGVSLFSDPVEGCEMRIWHDYLIAGLQKHGQGLSEAETEAIYHLVIDSNTCTLGFARRIIADHGGESVAEVFRLRDQPLDLVVEYLLHRYKGDYFRNRYPNAALVE